jgi:hypothetical protein
MEFFLSNKTKHLLDPEDALRYVGKAMYLSSNGYLRVSANNWDGDRYVHRDVLKAKKGESVDHINGNKLDNRKENLRICTHQQNMCNTKISIKNKSGVKGVHWSEERQKWSAQIAYKNKTLALGRFEMYEDAVKARKEAEKKYHGEFAKNE